MNLVSPSSGYNQKNGDEESHASQKFVYDSEFNLFPFITSVGPCSGAPYTMRRQAVPGVIIVVWVALLHRRCSDSWSVLSFDDFDADYCVNMSRSLRPC
jgi:hypothetical protein